MIKLFDNYLGILGLPLETKSIVYRYAILLIILMFFQHLSSTFIILHIIDKLGFTLAGITAGTILFTQVIFDFPTGGLSDKLGARWVLILSQFFFGVSFLFLSIATKFEEFLLIGIFLGLAQAQSSGTLETWLDNNYKETVVDLDDDRSIFGFFTSRISAISMIPSIIAFILGGIIATQILRKIVFIFQFILSFVIMGLIYFLLTDSIDFKNWVSNNQKSMSFVEILRESLQFTFSNKTSMCLILGFSFHYVLFEAINRLFLFPLFFGYSGTDLVTSFMRTLIWIAIFPLHVITANIGRRIQNNLLPYVILIHSVLLLLGWAVITMVIPIKNEFNIIGILGVIFVAVTVNGSLLEILMIIKRRILIDEIPSSIRNSIYSLIPTIGAFLGIFVIPIMGVIIELYGISFGIISLLMFSIIPVIFIYFSSHVKALKNKTKETDVKSAFS